MKEIQLCEREREEGEQGKVNDPLKVGENRSPKGKDGGARMFWC
jgi:hypothetical protein